MIKFVNDMYIVIRPPKDTNIKYKPNTYYVVNIDKIHKAVDYYFNKRVRNRIGYNGFDVVFNIVIRGCKNYTLKEAINKCNKLNKKNDGKERIV